MCMGKESSEALTPGVQTWGARARFWMPGKLRCLKDARRSG